MGPCLASASRRHSLPGSEAGHLESAPSSCRKGAPHADPGLGLEPGLVTQRRERGQSSYAGREEADVAFAPADYRAGQAGKSTESSQGAAGGTWPACHPQVSVTARVSSPRSGPAGGAGLQVPLPATDAQREEPGPGQPAGLPAVVGLSLLLIAEKPATSHRLQAPSEAVAGGLGATFVSVMPRSQREVVAQRVGRPKGGRSGAEGTHRSRPRHRPGQDP